jgi:hypothetical protein
MLLAQYSVYSVGCLIRSPNGNLAVSHLTQWMQDMVKYFVFCNFHDALWPVSPVTVGFGTFAVVNPTENGKLVQRSLQQVKQPNYNLQREQNGEFWIFICWVNVFTDADNPKPYMDEESAAKT